MGRRVLTGKLNTVVEDSAEGNSRRLDGGKVCGKKVDVSLTVPGIVDCCSSWASHEAGLVQLMRFARRVEPSLATARLEQMEAIPDSLVFRL